jgi:multiple sugar transport system substrate-binding protein
MTPTQASSRAGESRLDRAIHSPMGSPAQSDYNEVKGNKMKSTHRVGRAFRRTALIATVGVALSASLVACSTSSGGTAKSGQAAITAALQKKTTLTMWGWAPGVSQEITAFEKKYPKVTVKLVNAGTGGDEYTKLQNAIKAGSGAPDVAQIEYFALPQFALSGGLSDLGALGLDSNKSKFAPAVWDSVTVNGTLVGLPQDTGPMALFYNKTIFDKYGLTVPKTWDEYAADAKKLHAANPSEYITNDTGDPGFVTSMIWDAGGHPYTVTGKTSVNINLQDPGSKKFADTWSQLIQGGDLSPISSWSSQWNQGLSNGTIASLVTGAWMPGNLEGSVAPTGKGDWRVAPMPTWTAGGAPATAENGGSSDAVLKQSKHQLAAAGFLQFLNASTQGTKIFADAGNFPSINTILDSASFQNAAPAYFGGQQINKVLSAAAKSVIPGWSYVPFQVYANSIFSDTVGQAYSNKTDLSTALKAWGSATATYGSQQGFTVTNK